MWRTRGRGKRPLRFFLGYIDICGVYRSIEMALNRVGARACFLNLGNEHRPLAKPQPIFLQLFKWYYVKFCGSETLVRVSGIRQYLVTAVLKLLIVLLITWIAFRFDVVVIKSGELLTRSGKELRFLKWLGKIIIVSYHGSDARPFYLNGVRQAETSLQTQLIEMRRRKDRYLLCASLADFLIDSPATAQLQSTQCCMRQVIGNPAPIEAFQSISEMASHHQHAKLRILHAPSLPKVKGTDVIRSVVKRLQEAGYDFDYVEVTNLPNSAVLEEIMNCDIMIDELYSDNYGGIAALEALTAGKPVVVCGYAKEELDRFVPDWARAPTLYCHPSRLEDVLVHLLEDASFRERQQMMGKRFVDGIANPDRVAERLIQLAAGEAPENWFFDPTAIRYVQGAAGPESNVRANIQALVKLNGEGSLLLDDKPQLKKRMLSFAACNDLQINVDASPSPCSSPASSPAS